jgi:peptidoglycan/LPS O-acetylase OafA/YrhL
MRLGVIVASLTSLPFTLPHVVEDFAEGIAGRAGLSTGVAAFLLGGVLALQSLALVLVARNQRRGLVLALAVSVIWLAGAVVEHGGDLVGGRFRGGGASTVWILGLMTAQAATAVLAAWTLLREHR